MAIGKHERSSKIEWGAGEGSKSWQHPVLSGGSHSGPLPKKETNQQTNHDVGGEKS